MQNALRLASVTVEVQSIALGLLLILSVVIPTFAHQAKSAVDRVRGGRPPPADSVARGEAAHLVGQRRNSVEAQIDRADRSPSSASPPWLFAACSSSGSSASAAAPAPRRRVPPLRAAAPAPQPAPIKVGYLPKDIVNQYFAAAKTGIDKAATELGGTVIQVGPNEPKADLQVPFIKDLTTQQVNAIIISADGADEVAPT